MFSVICYCLVLVVVGCFCCLLSFLFIFWCTKQLVDDYRGDCVSFVCCFLILVSLSHKQILVVVVVVVVAVVVFVDRWLFVQTTFGHTC